MITGQPAGQHIRFLSAGLHSLRKSMFTPSIPSRSSKHGGLPNNLGWKTTGTGCVCATWRKPGMRVNGENTGISTFAGDWIDKGCPGFYHRQLLQAVSPSQKKGLPFASHKATPVLADSCWEEFFHSL